MSNSKEVLAKLRIIEDMATEASVKQLSKVMQEYIKITGKQELGFKSDEGKND